MQTSKPLPENLTDLRFAEQLTLWSIRYWADACRSDHSPYVILKDAYKLAKCPDGLLALDSFMTLLVSGNSRPVDIRCLCCSGISIDEWRILQSLAALQRGEKHMVPRLISHFLEPSTTRIACPLIRDWAISLSAGNHRLPVRQSALSAGQQYHPSIPKKPRSSKASSQEHQLMH